MGRPRRKVILFIVEGQSDLEALERPVSAYVQKLSSEVDVFFYKSRTDITSDRRNNPDNIVNSINKYFLDKFFSENGFIYPKDILEVVQISDLDGAFISDDYCKMFTPEIFAEDGFVYDPTYIYGASKEDVVFRNRIKSTNLLYLSTIESIKIKSKTVPYSIYYFSSNIDHFLYNEPNGTQAEKIYRAERFADSIEREDIDISLYFDNDPNSVKNLDYESSWKYITQENRSIYRGTNLNIYLNQLKDRLKQGSITT